jgi:hypothetical protein
MRIKPGREGADYALMKLVTLVLGAALALAPAAAASSDDDRAQRALMQVRVGLQPGHVAVIKEGFESTLYYKVCVHRKAQPTKRKCSQAQTDYRGRGRVSLSRFVAKNGRGAYVVEWSGGGLQLGSKSFRG